MALKLVETVEFEARVLQMDYRRTTDHLNGNGWTMPAAMVVRRIGSPQVPMPAFVLKGPDEPYVASVPALALTPTFPGDI